MPNLNKVMLMGNLTRDPEIKYTPKGTAIASLSLAVNRTFTPEGGEKREEVTFIDVELWGRTAEIVGEYFKKGRPIFIEGRLRLDSWDDKATGQKRSKLKVVGESFEFIGSRDNAGGGGGGGGGYEGGSGPDDEMHQGPSRGSQQRPQSQPQRRPPTQQAPPPARKPIDPDLDTPDDDDIPF